MLHLYTKHVRSPKLVPVSLLKTERSTSHAVLGSDAGKSRAAAKFGLCPVKHQRGDVRVARLSPGCLQVISEITLALKAL